MIDQKTATTPKHPRALHRANASAGSTAGTASTVTSYLLLCTALTFFGPLACNTPANTAAPGTLGQLRPQEVNPSTTAARRPASLGAPSSQNTTPANNRTTQPTAQLVHKTLDTRICDKPFTLTLSMTHEQAVPATQSTVTITYETGAKRSLVVAVNEGGATHRHTWAPEACRELAPIILSQLDQAYFEARTRDNRHAVECLAVASATLTEPQNRTRQHFREIDAKRICIGDATFDAVSFHFRNAFETALETGYGSRAGLNAYRALRGEL